MTNTFANTDLSIFLKILDMQFRAICFESDFSGGGFSKKKIKTLSAFF